MRSPSPPVPTARSGFTLLEISIVLIIIGIITGSIYVGQHLYRSAQLHTALTEMESMRKAVEIFREKYNALPGDMPNATSLWGTDPGGCPNTASNTVKKTETCNGDGDGNITVYLNSATRYEAFRAFQHLSNAELIEGSYSGVSGPLWEFHAMIDVNVPKSWLSGAGYTLYSATGAQANPNYFNREHKHILAFGAQSATDATIGPIVTAQEALIMDQKIDDGKPGTGRFYSWPQGSAFSANCTTSANPDTAQYDTTRTTRECSLIFQIMDY